MIVTVKIKETDEQFFEDFIRSTEHEILGRSYRNFEWYYTMDTYQGIDAFELGFLFHEYMVNL